VIHATNPALTIYRDAMSAKCQKAPLTIPRIMRMNRLLLVLLCTAVFLLSSPLLVAGRHESEQAREARRLARQQAQTQAIEAKRRGEILPLVRILEIAHSYAPGEVIEVEYKAGPLYKIKILLENGRVLKIKLDARDGRLLDREYD